LGTLSLSWPSFQTPTCTHPCASSPSTCAKAQRRWEIIWEKTRLKIHSVHKKSNEGQCQWFTPLFLTTWETEIRMIWVWWQLKEIVQEISSLKSAEQNALEVWFTTPVPWGKMCEETNAIVHETFGSEVYLTNSKVN
jgi:hypothetical protein